MTTVLTNSGLHPNTHVDAGLQLVQRDAAAVAQHLAADVLTDGGGAWGDKLH